MTISVQIAEPVGALAGAAWRRWNLAGLTALTAYSTALGWQAQLVSYPLYRAVAPDDFGAYHAQYESGIPLVVVGPGFVSFLAGAAFWWTRPAHVPRSAAGIVSAAGVAALLSTVLWAIPAHDRLGRDGFSHATVDSLLQANLVRSLALTAGTLALVWCVGRLGRGTGRVDSPTSVLASRRSSRR
jgi:hypothetical protein